MKKSTTLAHLQTDALHPRRLAAESVPHARDKEVAKAIIKSVCAVPSAEISPDKVVVRFSEAVDGFALPPGHTHPNVDLPVEKN